MKDTINNEVVDTAIDHETHNTYRKDCSNCWTENMVAKQSVRRDVGKVMEHNRRTLNRTFNGESPWDRNPLE